MQLQSQESEARPESLNDLALSCVSALHPPERISVSEAAAKYRFLNNPKAYSGIWQNEKVPYLVEPMNTLTDYAYEALIFVSAAQCGKTEIILNWFLHTVLCNPASMLIVEKKLDEARDFSKRRIADLHANCPQVRKKLVPDHDNILSKEYDNGARVMIVAPSANSLAGKPIAFAAATDFDRFPLDIDDEGNPFQLLRARTTSFRRHGMTLVESSPSKIIQDPNWNAATPHEAPPTKGILSLYNQGDRRRWYWQCVFCAKAFEPDFKLLKWKTGVSPSEAGQSAYMECPHCSGQYRQGGDNGSPTSYEMNVKGVWLKDGEKLTPDGEIIGNPVQSEVASFWLKGVAAAFQTWPKLVREYLNADQEYAKTGNENSLKTVFNTMLGDAYLPKSMQSDRYPEQLKDSARNIGEKVVPPEVRFLVAAVDVQANRFEVLVLGVSEGNDLWVIDRFKVEYSNRMDKVHKDQRRYVAPFVYPQDWRRLVPEVLLKTYPLDDESGRHMRLKAVVCDSAGQNKATANAYSLWRWLRDGISESDPYKDEHPLWDSDLFRRFQLFKGLSTQTAPRTAIRYPDSKRSDKYAAARKDIPVLMANVNMIKSDLDSQLGRETPQTGRINFPNWLPLWVYKELCAETLDAEKGIWRKIRRDMQNETWDLFVMAKALMIEATHVNIERIDWDSPPSWAAPWDDNDLVFDPAEQEKLENSKNMSLEEIGEEWL